MKQLIPMIFAAGIFLCGCGKKGAETSVSAEPTPADDLENFSAAPAASTLDAELVAQAKAALEKGLDRLVAQQNESGFWSDKNFPALSALPLWALAAGGRDADADAIAKAKEFLKSCAQPDGGIYMIVPGRRGGALGTYNTAICMTALHFTGDVELAPIILGARKYISETQLLGDDTQTGYGGFGYELNAPNDRADLNNSSWALAAMRITQGLEELRPAGEPKVDINWDAALAYVENMQIKPAEEGTDPGDVGGFLYVRPSANDTLPPEKVGGNEETPAQPRPLLRSYGSITYSGILSMIYAQTPRNDPRVVSAIDYARRHWTVDENPGQGDAGLFYYYTIMARTLNVAKMDALPAAEDGGEPVEWRKDLITKILSLQTADGSWANANNRWWESNAVLSTSYSLLALEYALGYFE